jgi:signal transduction histidine kinase
VQALELDQQIRTERERISRDLHDHVGAQVTTMLAAIELTGLTAAQGDLARVQRGLVDLREDAQRTMTQLRETVWSLRHDQVTVADLAAQIRDDLASRQRVLEQPRLQVVAEGTLSVVLGAGQGLHLFHPPRGRAARAGHRGGDPGCGRAADG